MKLPDPIRLPLVGALERLEKRIHNMQIWFSRLMGGNPFVVKRLHLSYTFGDLTVWVALIGLLACLWNYSGSVFVYGALLLSTGFDTQLFGKTLMGADLKDGSFRKYKALESIPTGIFVLNQSEKAYRPIQKMLNLTLLYLTFVMWGWIYFVVLAIMFATGVHDRLFYVLLGHRLLKRMPEPWLSWTPWGIVVGLVKKRAPTRVENLYQALAGFLIASILGITLNLWV